MVFYSHHQDYLYTVTFTCDHVFMVWEKEDSTPRYASSRKIVSNKFKLRQNCDDIEECRTELMQYIRIIKECWVLNIWPWIKILLRFRRLMHFIKPWRKLEIMRVFEDYWSDLHSGEWDRNTANCNWINYKTTLNYVTFYYSLIERMLNHWTSSAIYLKMV